MRKLTYLLAAGALSIMASCSGNKAGYVITGTVEGGADGDTVLLQERVGRDWNNLDTTIIADGKFEFKGVQDTAAYRYITWSNAEDKYVMDLFVENGVITVSLGKTNDSATGTPTNDIYQPIREKLGEFDKQYNDIVGVIRNDTTLTEEQRAEMTEKLNEIGKGETEFNMSSMFANIENPVGLLLFKNNFYGMTVAENDSALNLLPEKFQNDETVLKIKETVATQKRTSPGAKFTDVELTTPDGTPVKLSDYVGKGKLVLVDFWASWCGPCRREMPNIVEIYKDYKGDKFEIVGISLDSDASAWTSAISTLGITWPQMSDLKGWDNEAAKLYAVNSIPCVLLIDGEGTIIERGLQGKKLREKVDELMK
jgi:thiol-disulfide isomerase/thioredoxin